MHRWLLLVVCLITQASCVSYSSFYEGMSAFRASQYRQAFILLKPQAQKGLPDAEYAVGYMYYYGQGVVEDRKKAWYWISKAARAGQPDALAAMSILAAPLAAQPKRPAIE